MKKNNFKSFLKKNKLSITISALLMISLISFVGYKTYKGNEKSLLGNMENKELTLKEEVPVDKTIKEEDKEVIKKEDKKEDKKENIVKVDKKEENKKNKDIENNKNKDKNVEYSKKEENRNNLNRELNNSKNREDTSKNKENKKVKKEEQGGLAEKIGKSNIGKETNQIILVTGNKLSLWDKDGNGKWKNKLTTNSNHGYGGFTSNKHEGDGKTPTGVYPILYAFGMGKNPGTSLEYKRITSNSYFVDDPKSSHYNEWYEGKGEKGEHMKDHYQYKYGMVIGYNTNKIRGKGSAIFLHCNGRGNTAGCISVSESQMIKLMKEVHDGAYIVITTSENNLSKY